MNFDRIDAWIDKHAYRLTAVCFALAALALYQDIRALSEMIDHHWPLEYNSFYYLVEFREYAKTGHGYYSHFLPFFAVFSSLAAWLGLSEISLYNMVVSTSFFGFCIALAAIGLDRRRPFVFPALLYLALSSRMLFFGHYSFLKQATGMTALCTFLALFRLSKSDALPKTKKGAVLALSAFFVVAAAAFHKFSGLLAILYLALPFERHLKWKWKVLLTGTAVALFLFLWLDRHPDGSDLFHISWPPDWFVYFARKQMSLFELVEYLEYFILAALLGAGMFLYRFRDKLTVLSIALFSCTAAFFTTPSAWRLGVSGGWLFLMTIAFLQASKTEKNRLQNGILFAGVFFVGINSIFCSKSPRLVGPAMSIRPLEEHQELLRRWLPDDALLIAPHGVQFRVKYFLDRESVKTTPANVEPSRIYHLKWKAPLGESCIDISNFEGDPSNVECFVLDSYWVIERSPRA